MDAELPEDGPHPFRQLADEDRSLKTNSNAIRPINRLPVELFVEIIHMTKGYPKYDFKQPKESLVPLSSVCSVWRHVVCTTPRLWKRIHIRNNLQWLSLCLQRSKETPIQIYLHSPSSVSTSLDVLSNHAHRIQKIKILRTEYGTFDLLTAFFRPSMTLLTNLCINNQNENGISWFATLGESIHPSVLPSLRVLKLESAYLDWLSPSIRQLRELKLRDWTPDVNLTLAQFLRALEACEALEILTLDFALPFNTYDAESGGRNVSGPIVTLSNMRKMYILCPHDEEPSSPDVYHLLSHLTLPASTVVHIYSQIDVEVTTDRGGFLDTVPSDPERLPVLRTATIAKVWRNGFMVDVDLYNDWAHSEGHLSIQLEPIGDDDDTVYEWAYPSKRGLREFCTLFARAPLRDLTVDIRRMAPTEATWRRLFRTFSELTELAIENMAAPGDETNGDDRAWLRVLSRCGSQTAIDTDTVDTDTEAEVDTDTDTNTNTPDTDSDSDSDTDTATETDEHEHDDGGIMLSKLCSLRIVDADGCLDEDMYKMIADCLRLRDAQGARLSELHLEVQGTSTLPIEDHERLSRDLETLVDGPCVYTISFVDGGEDD